MVAALVSVAMMAGENDLLWDYTDGAPSCNPDNNLYYESKINDGPGTKNGLYGIKLNSSGYACFTKAAVAGKLKLTFSPRSGSNATSVEVWNCSGEASAHTKGDTKYVTTGQQTELGTQIVELDATQNNIYLCRGPENVETCLTKIQFVEDVPRDFTDFKIDFRNDPYTVLLPESGELPEGVTVTGTTYNGGQHGIQGGTIKVPVDGPVKFTIGACQYSGSPIHIGRPIVPGSSQLAGEGSIDNNAPCGETAGHFDQYVTHIYTGGATTLYFTIPGNTYVPYFFAEATELIPCEIIFKDQNGNVISRKQTYEGAKLDYFPADSQLPTIVPGEVLRGWYYTNGKKAKGGDPITGNTTIQAKVTPYEVAEVGAVYTYDFADQTFYPEDHEIVNVTNGAYHDGTHGWYFETNGMISVYSPGTSVVVVTLCTYSESGTVSVNSNNTGHLIASAEVVKNEMTDGTELVAQYSEGPGWVNITWDAKQYIHKVVVYNVEYFMEKDETTGYYKVPAGDAASLILAIVQAQAGDKIFLPNGTYDLGETVLTTISKNNISLIGQSMEGVIIKNAPDAAKESIDKTATLKINKNVEGTYLQDLTIQNALDYYKNNNGRAVCLWDQGKKTICKNVKLLSYQDTYYSNLVGAVKYFEDCEIHGTVDFICGDGSVYFKNNVLVAEQRNKDGGGSDALTASNADVNDRGYVFESCTVKYAPNIQGNLPVISFGRAWNNAPKTIFLNTVLDDSNGALNMYKDANAQKDKISRWTLGAMNALPYKFGEFNSVDKNGAVVSPASNEVTFVLGTNEKTMETILTADEAAIYTMDYTLGDWTATAAADATQAIVDLNNIDPEAIYMIENPNGYCEVLVGSQVGNSWSDWNEEDLLRKANGRGGFGPAVCPRNPQQGIEHTNAENGKVQKFFRDGQVIIVRDGREYTILGTEL